MTGDHAWGPYVAWDKQSAIFLPLRHCYRDGALAVFACAKAFTAPTIICRAAAFSGLPPNSLLSKCIGATTWTDFPSSAQSFTSSLPEGRMAARLALLVFVMGTRTFSAESGACPVITNKMLWTQAALGQPSRERA